MWANDKAPGVYKREDLVSAGPKLPTGVPGFIGFTPAGSATSLTSAKGATSLHLPVVLYRKDDFQVEAGRLPPSIKDGFLTEAINGFFLNGGQRCHVVYASAGDPEESVKEALKGLASLSDIDLIAVPDVMSLTPEDARERVQRTVLQYCHEHTGWMAILDALPGQNQEGVQGQRDRITAGMPEPVNGALYYPWIKTNERKLVPPCGHVAGIFARSDAREGVFKAPANEEVKGALDLETSINDQAQRELNPLGINCLRSLPGRGIRVWGARTLSSDSNWRYISVRRLFLTLQRWIELNMGWVSFEPNTPTLWVRIERELSSYLSGLWLEGALAGQSADEAFYVKCDIETNPPETESAGQVITEIGLAASAPAEYIVVRVVHHTGVDPR